MDMPRFILSCRPTSGERTQLLRPRMLDEYTLPNVGMIMYGFFWVKYGLWLRNQGLDPRIQSELLLWTEYPDGSIRPSESILYYSLLLIYFDNDASNIPGRDITRGWLFAKQPPGIDHYAAVVHELDALNSESHGIDGSDFVESVIAPWLRTRCAEEDVDLAARIEAELEPALTADHESEQARIEALLDAFITAIGRLCHEYPTFYKGYNTSPIDQPFDISEMLWEVAPSENTPLANVTPQITQTDVEALFTLLERFERGHRMLHSFIFLAYLGPEGPRNDQLRDIHLVCREQTTTIIETAEANYNYRFDANISKDIIATSFFYELNYVLAEGETIARKLLTTSQRNISLNDVKTFFEDRRGDLPISRFEAFVISPDSVEAHLPWLIEQYAADGDEDVAAFLDELRRSVAEGQSPEALLLELLAYRDVLEPFKEAEDTYKVVRLPSTESSASFYGVGAMQDYAAELLEAVPND